MFNKILYVFSAVVSVQCLVYLPQYPPSCPCGMPQNPPSYPCGMPQNPPSCPCGMPQYPPPCPCGMPVMPALMPANPPCASPAPISIFSPSYDIPLPVALPAGLPKGPIFTAPLPVGPPCGLPVGLPLPAPVAKPSCGCLEAAVSTFELPLPVGSPLGNPFLPAASPISALAPFLMQPPACPCSRCQYLKKIPIPPPCI